MDLVEPVFVAQGAFGRMRELQKLLSRHSIDAEIIEPPGAKPNT